MISLSHKCLTAMTALFLSASIEAEERIISLAPHITELLFAVGAGDEVVGVMSYSNYPEAANAIPVIGTNEKLNFEQIIALQPTLVFGWDGGNSSDAMARLESLGMEVHRHNPHTLEDVGESLRWLGELSGHAVEGQAAATSYFERLASLRENYAKQSELAVYYQIWNEPQLTVNDQHIISDVIRLCGGRNIFGEAIPLVPKISMESVLQRNPQVILMAGVPGAHPERLEQWQRWSSIAAIASGNLYEVDPDLLHRHSPRILDGTEQVCQALERARAVIAEDV